MEQFLKGYFLFKSRELVLLVGSVHVIYRGRRVIQWFVYKTWRYLLFSLPIKEVSIIVVHILEHSGVVWSQKLGILGISEPFPFLLLKTEKEGVCFLQFILDNVKEKGRVVPDVLTTCVRYMWKDGYYGNANNQPCFLYSIKKNKSIWSRFIIIIVAIVIYHPTKALSRH